MLLYSIILYASMTAAFSLAENRIAYILFLFILEEQVRKHLIIKSIHWLISFCMYQVLLGRERGTDLCTKLLEVFHCLVFAFWAVWTSNCAAESQIAQGHVASAMLGLQYTAHQPEK